MTEKSLPGCLACSSAGIFDSRHPPNVPLTCGFKINWASPQVSIIHRPQPCSTTNPLLPTLLPPQRLNQASTQLPSNTPPLHNIHVHTHHIKHVESAMRVASGVRAVLQIEVWCAGDFTGSSWSYFERRRFGPLALPQLVAGPLDGGFVVWVWFTRPVPRRQLMLGRGFLGEPSRIVVCCAWGVGPS